MVLSESKQNLLDCQCIKAFQKIFCIFSILTIFDQFSKKGFYQLIISLAEYRCSALTIPRGAQLEYRS